MIRQRLSVPVASSWLSKSSQPAPLSLGDARCHRRSRRSAKRCSLLLPFLAASPAFVRSFARSLARVPCISSFCRVHDVRSYPLANIISIVTPLDHLESSQIRSAARARPFAFHYHHTHATTTIRGRSADRIAAKGMEKGEVEEQEVVGGRRRAGGKSEYRAYTICFTPTTTKPDEGSDRVSFAGDRGRLRRGLYSH